MSDELGPMTRRTAPELTSDELAELLAEFAVDLRDPTWVPLVANRLENLSTAIRTREVRIR